LLHCKTRASHRPAVLHSPALLAPQPAGLITEGGASRHHDTTDRETLSRFCAAACAAPATVSARFAVL
jgi:hypothetical protein